MYIVVTFDFSSRFTFLPTLLKAHAQACGIQAHVTCDPNYVYVSVDEEQESTDRFFRILDTSLPASVFLRGVKAERMSSVPGKRCQEKVRLPLHSAPCPSCQKEMFDVASRRYYYPFTSCNGCGAQSPFLERYPFVREHSTMRFFVPCEACRKELEANPFRRDYPLISCVECGIPLKMTDGKSERFANTKGEYRRLFEVCARALLKGKSIRIKTLMGYRYFFMPDKHNVADDTFVLFADAGSMNEHLMMVPEEFDALLSIERPILRVATKSETFKSIFGSSVLVKYADEGMSMLLGRELMNAGKTYVAFCACDETKEADYSVDFDVPIRTSRDMTLFINRDIKRIVRAERVVFPQILEGLEPVMTVANGLAAVPYEGVTLVDTLEMFEEAQASEVRLLEGASFESSHSRTVYFPRWRAAMLSVLAEHDRLGEPALGVHFDTRLSFLYYNGKKVLNVLPSEPFSKAEFWDRIASLREGSDRLVANFRAKYPDIVKRWETSEDTTDMFVAAALLMGLERADMEGISAEALTFLGKGGLQVDTRINANRFDAYAFLASIMSYKVADVPNAILCYSIYESFGDYIGEIVAQMSEKFKSKRVVLTGETFGNQALFARIERALAPFERLMNETLPIGEENAVVGGLYI